MAGSGPAPNPASRRQSGNQAHTWTELPGGGYAGVIPDWPLPPVAEIARAERELQVWSHIWRTPQAEMWHLNGWVHDVAMYVRYLVLGESGQLDSAKEARMWSDRLGLNPAAMLKNRWRVRPDEVAVKRAEAEAAAAAGAGTAKPKRRLKAADDGAVAGA